MLRFQFFPVFVLPSPLNVSSFVVFQAFSSLVLHAFFRKVLSSPSEFVHILKKSLVFWLVGAIILLECFGIQAFLCVNIPSYDFSFIFK